jgi:hypothetical protein
MIYAVAFIGFGTIGAIIVALITWMQDVRNRLQRIEELLISSSPYNPAGGGK